VRIPVRALWRDISGADRFFHNQMIHDVFPTLWRIFAHIKLQERLDDVSVINRNWGKAHVGPNKMLELRRRNFSQPFEPGYFVIPDLLHSLVSFFF
jgi:hypothetical protein